MICLTLHLIVTSYFLLSHARQHPFEVSSTPEEFTTTSLISPTIDAFIGDILTDWNSPGGVSVSVVKKTPNGGWRTEAKGYGLAKADGTPVTDKSLFAIASNSKLFAALSAGLLISNTSLEPPLTWKTKVASVIPDWSLMDPIASSGANIADIMSHRTGLPRHDYAFSPDIDVAEMFKRLPHLKPSAEFRETWQYNNWMFAILAQLPSTLIPSQPSFTQYIQENIFDPLKLASTTYSFNTANKSGHLAHGFARQPKNSTASPFDAGIPRALPFWAQKEDHIHCGPGGVITSANDMIVWLQTLLSDGRSPHTNLSVIPKDVLDVVASGITAQSPWTYHYPADVPAVYGGGQSRSTYRGHVIVGHDGSVPGFKSMIYRLPADGVGIAVLSNDENLGSYINLAVHHRLLDDLLGLPPLDSKKIVADLILEGSKRPPSVPRHPKAKLPSRGLESLPGMYRNHGYGSIELCYINSDADPQAIHSKIKHPESQGSTSTCRDLVSQIPTLLPNAINPDIPTLLGRWSCGSDGCMFARLGHFDGNLFNLSIIQSVPTGNVSEPYWTANLDEPSALAEFGLDNDGGAGFALTGGVWGAGVDVTNEGTLQDQAEVWFSST